MGEVSLNKASPLHPPPLLHPLKPNLPPRPPQRLPRSRNLRPSRRAPRVRRRSRYLCCTGSDGRDRVGSRGYRVLYCDERLYAG
ncbi:unnamed protein product [Zymoseptoria tritici ST99CH_3D7]|uniref:Uncharacterized protein n=1 Tax=Zymoseptoria tritici (strain ST99CH_3D7) TaxID=1276538 RepID=A0A1X7S5J2_ZYMT9|nr:unnamed protein product [Zymoseptoria tritici ST99CH_3D7]